MSTISRLALVYFDQGVSEQSANALVDALTSILPSDVSVQKVGGTYLAFEMWEGRTVVLAMGGGSCSEWDNSIGEKGLEKISDYVHGGGRFIGFCAGAYFAAKESFFQLTDKDPIEKKRGLSFCSAKAIGPIVKTTDHLSLDAARALEISFMMDDYSSTGCAYYQGGCHFLLDPDTDETKPVAFHENRSVAVISKVGDGSTFLCGLHLEFAWPKKLHGDGAFGKLTSVLTLHEVFRKEIWCRIFKSLNLPTKP